MSEAEPLPLGVLASGAGTNLQALLDSVHAEGVARIVAVGSDQPDPPALARARAATIPARAFPSADHADRAARDRAMGAWLAGHGARAVVLAGYMRLLDPAFLGRFAQGVINVHPALLPAFPGLDAVGQALAYGVRVFGVTVHFVDEGIDTGPIILQRAIELPQSADRIDVTAALRRLEHVLLPEAVRLLARGALALDPANPRRVIVRAHD